MPAMPQMRTNLALALMGAYLLFWLGLRHDELPAHDTAHTARRDPHSNFGGVKNPGVRAHAHGPGARARRPPAMLVLSPRGEAEAGEPPVDETLAATEAGQEGEPEEGLGEEMQERAPEEEEEEVLDDGGALDASGVEEGSVEAEVKANEEEEEVGNPTCDSVVERGGTAQVAQVAQCYEDSNVRLAPTQEEEAGEAAEAVDVPVEEFPEEGTGGLGNDGVGQVEEGEELVVWEEEEVEERWEEQPEGATRRDAAAAATAARVRAATRRPVTRGAPWPSHSETPTWLDTGGALPS